MAQTLPIAGWYPDPELAGHDRWWDGSVWSDNRRATTEEAPGATPGEVRVPAAAPVVRNNLAVIGFILSISSVLLPFVINSFAGGIVSVVGLRHSAKLAGSGTFSPGRGLSIAGILVGFIWGTICLLFVLGVVAFLFWVFQATPDVQYPDSPVI